MLTWFILWLLAFPFCMNTTVAMWIDMRTTKSRNMNVKATTLTAGWIASLLDFGKLSSIIYNYVNSHLKKTWWGYLTSTLQRALPEIIFNRACGKTVLCVGIYTSRKPMQFLARLYHSLPAYQTCTSLRWHLFQLTFVLLSYWEPVLRPRWKHTADLHEMMERRVNCQFSSVLLMECNIVNETSSSDGASLQLGWTRKDLLRDFWYSSPRKFPEEVVFTELSLGN